MKVYEFYLKSESQAQTFEALCDSFNRMGSHFERAVDKGIYPDLTINAEGKEVPHAKAGQPIIGNAVYSVSRNPHTHWVQLLVDDNTPSATIMEIEAQIAALKDGSLRTFEDELHSSSPMETPKHFTLEQVLEVRRQQKEEALGPVDDVTK